MSTKKRKVWRVFTTDRFGSASVKRGTYFTPEGAARKAWELRKFYRGQQNAPHIQVEPGEE